MAGQVVSPSLVALRAANGNLAGPTDGGIETALLEVERDVLGGRDNLAAPGYSNAVPAAAMGGGGPDPLRRPPQVSRTRGAQLGGGEPSLQRRIYPRSGSQLAGGKDEPDGDSVQKIAGDVVQAVDKRYGGLVARLRCRIRDYEKRVDFARTANDSWRSEKSTLEERIEDLNFEVSDLRDQIASAVASASAGGGGGGGQRMIIGARQGKSLQQKMQNMKSGVGLDVDIEGMEQDTGIASRIAVSGSAIRMRLRFRRLLQQFTPLTRDIKLISSRYGRACGGFFRFHRFLGFLSCGMLLLYLPLLVPQALSERENLITSSCGNFPFGCGWLYGGFHKASGQTRDVWLAFRYILCVVVSALTLMLLSIARWSQQDFTYQGDVLGDELQPRQWSRLVLAAWDFRLRPGEDRHNWGQGLSNQLRSLREDELENERANERTRRQRYLLYLRRACGVVLNLALIGGGWTAIIMATVERDKIVDDFQNTAGVGAQLSGFLPNVIVAMVGMVLPTATKTITWLEGWSPTVQARQDLWRLYLGKILNVFIFVALNIEVVVGQPLFGQEEVLVEREVAYTCAEDQAGVRLLSLVISEFVLTLGLRPVSSLLSSYAFHFLFKSLNFESDFQKPPFEMADYAVDIIYFQCILWSTALFVPSVVLVAPLLLFAHFKWLKFALTVLSSRPMVAETSALSVALLQLHCASCALFVALAFLLLTRSLPHAAGCGPFDAGLSPGSMLGRLDAPGSETVKTALAWLAANPGIVLPFAALLVLVLLMKRNRSRALRAGLGEVQRASQRHVEALEGELWRMERQNDLLNRRVQWHEKPFT